MVKKYTGSFSKTVSSGVMENVLIDGKGQKVEIRLTGNGTLKNVAIINASNHPAPVQVYGGGHKRMINCFIKGVNDNCIFVNETHNGSLRIEDTYLGDAVEDGIYGSPAGNPDYRSGKAPGGHQGTVELINVMAENCRDYGLRFGSHKSFAKDCIVKDCGTGLANLYGNPVTFENCDVRANKIGIKHIDHDDRNVGNWPEEVRTVLKGVRVQAPDKLRKFSTKAGKGTIVGSVSRNPDVSYPSGIPITALDAAGGTSSDPNDPSSKGRHLVVDGSDTEQSVKYRLVGNASAVEPGNMTKGEGGDNRLDIRTWEGHVKNGKDDFHIHSSEAPHITELVLKGENADLQSINITLDGNDVKDEARLVVEHRGPPLPKQMHFAGNGTYEVTTDGRFKKTEDKLKSSDKVTSINTNDTINGNEISGAVGGGVDGYRFDGNIESVTISPDVRMYVEQKDVTPKHKENIDRIKESVKSMGYAIENVKIGSNEISILYKE